MNFSYIRGVTGLKRVWEISREQKKEREFFLLNPLHLFLFVNWVLWIWVSEIRVVISCILSLLISGFLLLSSPVDVGTLTESRKILNILSSLILFLLLLFVSQLVLAISGIRNSLLQ